jgi:hypothetical protein
MKPGRRALEVTSVAFGTWFHWLTLAQGRLEAGEKGSRVTLSPARNWPDNSKLGTQGLGNWEPGTRNWEPGNSELEHIALDDENLR